MNTSHEWSPELVESVKRLYCVFASYRAKLSSIGPCPCCISDDELEALFAKPLRELDTETIYVFAYNAVSPHGSVTDFKHFLPRIFELFPDQLFKMDAPEIYIIRFRYAEWLTWPEKEIVAVRSFLLELWRWTLATYPAISPCFTLICAIAQAEDDLSPYLDEWDFQCRNDSSALRQLVDSYHLGFIVQGKQDKLELNAFWDERAKQELQLYGWLMGDTTREHIERAKHEYAKGWGMEQKIDLILVHQDIWRNKLRP